MRKYEDSITDLLGEVVEMVPQDSSPTTKGVVTAVNYESHEQVWTWSLSNCMSFHNHSGNQPVTYVDDDYVKTEWELYQGEVANLAAETVQVRSKSHYGDISQWYGVVESILIVDGKLSIKLFGHADPVRGKIFTKKP